STLTWSLSRLSAEMGCTRKTFTGHVRRIEDAGLITVEERPGHTFVITLLDLPPEADEQGAAPEIPTRDESDLRKNYPGGEQNLLDPWVEITHVLDLYDQKKETTPTPPELICDEQRETPEPSERAEDILKRLSLDPVTTAALEDEARKVLESEGAK